MRQFIALFSILMIAATCFAQDTLQPKPYAASSTFSSAQAVPGTPHQCLVACNGNNAYATFVLVNHSGNLTMHSDSCMDRSVFVVDDNNIVKLDTCIRIGSLFNPPIYTNIPAAFNGACKVYVFTYVGDLIFAVSDTSNSNAPNYTNAHVLDLDSCALATNVASPIVEDLLYWNLRTGRYDDVRLADHPYKVVRRRFEN